MRTLLLAAAGLAALAASPALAQDQNLTITQAGAANRITALESGARTVTIEQAGVNGSVTATALADSSSVRIAQDSSANGASVAVNQALDTMSASAFVSQSGSGRVTVRQSGGGTPGSQYLTATVQQGGTGTTTLNQGGFANFARLLQYDTDASGNASSVDSRQNGRGNNLSVDQTSVGTASTIVTTQGYATDDGMVQSAEHNSLEIVQAGEDQHLFAHQDNRYAFASIDQEGSRNLIDLTQGNSSILRMSQNGSDLSSSVYQAQNATARVTQTGDRNSLTLWQDGGVGWSRATATVVQSGTDNRITATQAQRLVP